MRSMLLEENSEPLTPPKPHNAPFEFAACLLVKDDNKILPEWLAYHYEVLPMRRLILAVDPNNITSPEPIIDKYREIGLNTTIWLDEDYIFEGRRWYQQVPPLDAPDDHKFKFHFWRQTAFMTRCLQQLHREGASYTLLIDSDEFLTYNHLGENEEEPIECRFLFGKRRESCNERYRKGWEDGTDLRAQLPAVGNATVAQTIVKHGLPSDLWGGRPCSTFARVNFGPNESTAEQLANQTPEGFDPMSFVTMRYRKHKKKQNTSPGKSIVNASGYRPNMRVGNPHRVLKDDCAWDVFVRHAEVPFRVHHYMGSLEMFISRPGDTHRSKKEYQRRTVGPYRWQDDTIRGWLQSFVDRVGKKRAWEFTQGLRKWAFADDRRASAKAKKDRARKQREAIIEAKRVEAIRRRPFKNRRKFVRYESSPWEQIWLDNISKWEKERTICKQLDSQVEQLRKFLRLTCTLRSGEGTSEGEWCGANDTLSTIWFDLSVPNPSFMPRVAPPPNTRESFTVVDPVVPAMDNATDEILSKFYFEDEVTGETFVEYIEPLVSHLRHPLAKCIRGAVPFEGRINHLLMFHRSYLFPIPTAGRAFKEQKFYYIDAGPALWHRGKGGPSLAPFVSLYRRHGIEFDYIGVWHPSEYRIAFQKSVPVEFKDRVEYHREWIAGEPRDNETFIPHWVRNNTLPGDFVMYKMDVSKREPTEEKVVKYLLSEEGREDANRITELYWEHHVKGNYFVQEGLEPGDDASQSLNASYHLFLQLRQVGIRAHGW
eukprot:CAMPEP_0116840616 /NCGR_PEP_ID=MMETSP0418-20121206/10461_1 /TAXON_ID=1158023 /ORGANISM="Astrosyne radiata, Strain 13vi08-1A" /LENGTH=766 /DNA_ID=CAMNT_0004470937 /DNA_START=167 /DNA_END=2464 /DNA_ORIENTATION=-